MTHPNAQTNGASLEDCHTNFFSLTELCGIKWRKLVWGEGEDEGVSAPLDDPVISSYTRCLAGDILCVWRRVAAVPTSSSTDIFDQLAPPPPSAPPPLSLRAAKELWIFWYGEEPDLNGLVAPELMSSAGVYGSWETGLSYECRSLLFKALHNLIERCLLSRDFIRLGKWFVQPYNGDEEEVGKSCWHLSFSFAFFVHGDNMVCASVDVRQHPPVRTLTQRRLAKLNKEDAPNTKVILAPFGLDGVLTGETFAASETATTRLLDAWRHFYPVEASSGAEGADGAGAVEVIAGGVRMRYPARYVMLTDIDPPVEKDPDPAAGGHPLSQHLPAKMAETMAERTYRNMMSQTPTSPNTPVAPVTVKMEPMDICGADASTESKVEWDFVDPIKKTACSCAKWRGCGAGVSALRRGDRANAQRRPATHAHTNTPFHRRNAHAHTHSDTLTCPSGGMGGMGGCGGTPGGACSPGSCASPATHSDGAAPAPSPSPHHSTAHQSQGQGQQQQPATPRSGNPQPPPLLHTPAPTPDPHAPSTPTPAPRTPHTPRTPRNQAMESPSQITVNGVGAGCGLVGGCELLKRPVLHAAEREPDPLDDEHTLHMLYDYSTMHAWLDHPVKRFKMESGAGTGAGGMGCGGLWEDRLTRIAGEDRAPHSQAATPDLYAGHNHIRMAPVLPNSVYLMRDVKQEPNDDANKEMKNLFTSDGLLPSYKDLDQIFDNSDDPGSGDETVRLLQVHTPPDSNKSGGCLGDDSLLLCGGGGGGRTGHVRPEELTKMFPTPPSLEHHPQPSPGAFTLPDTDLPVHTHHTTAPRAGSPQDEPIEDWSYVFKPPTICKYVGSSKYAPLTNLPSQVLPLVTLPAHCVYRPKFKPTANTTAPTTNGGEVILKQEMKEPRSVPPPSPASMKAGAGLRTPTHANQPHTPSHMLPLHQPLSNLHSVGVISAPSSVGPAASPLVVGPGPMSRPAPPPYMGAGGASPPPPRRPDACPLLLNVLLADTVLNIFRDHNFDSCTLCVCNEGPKEVGNIRGADCGVYLAPASVSSTASPGYGSPGSQPNSPLMQTGYEDNDHIKCSCGFSAVINRRLAHRAGLFYEDEMEITGLAEDPSEYKKHKNTEATMNSILELVREQCTGVRSSSNALVRAAREAAEDVSHDEMRVNMLEYTDGGDAAALALEAATAGDAPARCSLPTVHRWPFISARCPRSTQDVMRVLRRIRLLLVDAIQKKCTPVMWNAVDGPLTWRNFLHLAGRGTNDLCEPQPVPPILVGHDRDWLALSPSAIHYWDKLTLEPYSYARDAAYLVVAPDSEPLVENVRTFFRELSTAYEMCRLGRHTPLHRIAREGILRAPRTTGGSGERAEDEWAGTLPTGAVGEVLRSYAATLRSVLAPALAALQLDRALLEAEARADRRQHDSMPPPPDNAPPTTPNSQTEMETDNVTYASCQSTVGSGGGSVGTSLEGEEDEAGAPMLVVYLVEPSGLAGDPERRVGCLALLRCAAALENMLPEQLRPNVNVKIISMEAVTELSRWRSRVRRGDEMRALAMSVFTQSRRLLQHQPNIKSLTGFGTAASADVFLKNKDEKNRAAYRLYSPAYVLAPTKQARDLANTLQQTAPEPSPVLYVSYCLSADQDWLLAVATDSRGELLETAAINIHVPARARRRKATAARRLGLSKLMEFILGVMSQSAHPWRLVVGRIGRIGHGELRSWSGLLSRSNLLKASRTLRELCGSCSLSYSPGAPWILSACLVSTEPDSSLRIMADCYTPCERFSQVAARASHLHTPRDVSCTHILVFPTSAKAESSQSVFQEPTNETDFYPDLLSEITDDDVTGILDIDSLFEWPKRTEGASDEEGGGGSGAGSPGRAHRARSRGHSPAERQANGTSREVFQLQQQPLALGYLVSTAPLGAMPAWWWAACPHLAHLAGRCPTFLKNSLHLHCALTSNEDELGAPPTQAPSSNTHQLDSGITTDVLRYVLEGYNALSWLSLDSNTHDRLSCLPLHMQVLVQLYHTATALL